MPTDIRVIHAKEFIRATPDGQLNFETTKKLLLEIASASTPPARYEVLIDSRKSQARMSTTDLWYLAVELGKLRQAFSGKTAVLCPLERFDTAAFFALCAQNRGFRVQAFTSFEEAIDWLVANGTWPGQDLAR